MTTLSLDRIVTLDGDGLWDEVRSRSSRDAHLHAMVERIAAGEGRERALLTAVLGLSIDYEECRQTAIIHSANCPLRVFRIDSVGE